MLLTIVTPSLSTAQVFYLIAIVIFAVAIVLAIAHVPVPTALLGLAGLAFVALGLLFSP